MEAEGEKAGGIRGGGSVEVGRPHELGWGWLGLSCLWISDGAWRKDSGPQDLNLNSSSNGHSLWGLA